MFQPGVDGTYYGISIASAGDVNGDGETDFLIGESDYYPRSLVAQAPTLAGQTHLIFGGAANLAAMDLLDGVADGVINQSLVTAAYGYNLKYNIVGDGSGVSVEGAGQVDNVAGDDIVIGTPRSTANPGVAHLVSGGANLAVLDAADGTVDGQILLTNVNGSTGYQFVGTSNSDRNGYAVGSVGDVNNDGFRDILVGSYMADPPGANNGGIVALVFGAPANLSALDTAGGTPADGSISIANLNGTNGYRFAGAAADFAGVSLAGMNDLNGDGIADLIIGAQQQTLGGESYVVFGGAANLAALDTAGGAAADGLIALTAVNGTTGYRFKTTDDDQFGWSVSGAGDVNGDGAEDLLIGDPFGDSVSNNGGQAYLLFGGTANLSALDAADGVVDGSITADNVNGTTGFRVGGTSGQWMGQSVSAVGDVNGDGYGDVAIGANFRNTRTGAAYIMFGGPAGGSGFSVEDAADGAADGKINIGSFSGVGGMRIDGVATGDQAGFDVARIGDINGDGLADMMLSGVRDQSGITQQDTGEVYIVYSRLPDAAVNRTGTGIGQTLVGGNFDDTLSGLGGDDTLIGNGGADTLNGGTGNDTMKGGDGTDTLTGGGGQDTIDGGAGTDTVVVGASWLQTTITEGPAGTYQLTVGADVLTASNVEQFQFTNGTFAAGTIVDDAPIGVDDTDATLVEAGGGGAGTASASGNVLSNDTDADVALGDSLTVTGLRTGTEAAGGALAAVGAGTTLAGTYGSLTIDADGAWNYALDNDDPDTQALAAGQQVTETFTYGVTDAKGLADTAQLALTITGAGDGPTAVADKGYVSRGGITIPAADAAAALLANDSGDGPLTIQSVANATGGTAVIDGSGNLVITASTVPAVTTGGFDYTVADSGGTATTHVTLGLVTTSSGNNTVTIATLAGEFSFIDGMEGIDRLTGGAGSDTFYGGAGADTLVGGAGGDTLLGGADNDKLDGGTGADTMLGGAGNDTYTVDDAGDVVREDSTVGVDDGGMDLVNASASFTLGAFVENLTLTGAAAIDGTGNDLANKINGNSAANTLTGGAGIDILNGNGGADTMFGGAGNDTYTVDDAGDVVREDTTVGVDDGGMDMVNASASFTLGAFVENLTLTGAAAIDGTGNDLANKINGNSAANTLTGGAGIDILNGNGGADTMFGGAGNDTYTVDDAGDLVREDTTVGIDDGGMDMVNASVSYTLGAFAENLTLTGSAEIDGTGNGLANKIKGNSAANHLTGGAGADMLTGNGGADTMDGEEDGDTYVVDASDIIHDSGTSGIDKVQADGSFTLAAGSGIEQLATKAGVVGGDLTGDEAANTVTGNAGTNILNGAAGNDTLSGAAGTDTLVGGLGKDKMTGGTEADIFGFEQGDSLATMVGFDTVVDFETGVDQIDLSIFAGSAAAADYAEIAVASNVFATLKTAAEAQMTGGVKAVFVAGSVNGWLFWNTDATPGTAEEAVTLTGRNNLNAFAVTDLV